VSLNSAGDVSVRNDGDLAATDRLAFEIAKRPLPRVNDE